MSFSETNGWVQRGFQVTAMLNSLAALFILSIYAYGGFFSRYVADDYCEAVDAATLTVPYNGQMMPWIWPIR